MTKKTERIIDTQILEALLSGNNAIAAAVMADESLLTCAGDLSGEAFQYFEDMLKKYWLIEEHCDIQRYIAAKMDEQDILLYAKVMGNSNLLGLAFPIETPLKTIRSQTNKAIQNLELDDILPAPTTFPDKNKSPQPVKDQDNRPETIPHSAKADPLGQTLKGLPGELPQPDPEQRDDANSDWQAEFMQDPLVQDNPLRTSKNLQFEEVHLAAEILPEPFGVNHEPVIVAPNQFQDISSLEEDALQDIPLSQVLAFNWSQDQIGEETSATVKQVRKPDTFEEDQNLQQMSDQLPTDTILDDQLNLTTTQKEDQTQFEEQTDDSWQPIDGSDSLNFDSLSPTLDLELPTPRPEEQGLALQDKDSHPKIITTETPGPLQVPIQPSASICPNETRLESITFYLVPRLSYHYLLGELSHSLRRWVPIICKTFGWKLGALSVRPNYIKWSLLDFPESAVPGMLKLFRNESSASIFHDFPSLRTENHSTDYWSTSYLVDKDNQQFSTRSLMALIPANRKTV